jgi:fatty acid desaturase
MQAQLTKGKSMLETGRGLCESTFVNMLTNLTSAPVFLGTILLWLQLIFAFYISLSYELFYAIPGLLIICACQQGMQLWTHEGSHYNLFKNHKLNDLWTDFFFSTPLGVTVDKYRSHHLAHHAYLSTPKDLERWQFSSSVANNKLLKLILESISGYYGIKIALVYLKNSKKELAKIQMSRVLMTLFWNLLLCTLCYLSNRWYLYFLLWALPVFTVSTCINILRTTSEHQPIGFRETPDNVSIPEIVRTTKPNFLEKWFMYQTNFNYHVEHHMYPNVPFYNLPALHTYLKSKNFYKTFPDCLQKSCFDSLLKLNKQKITI